MNLRNKFYAWIILALTICACDVTPDLGIFEGKGDIGNVRYAGSVVFDPSDSSYTVSGGGTNMWFNSDELHYVWKQVTGDISLAADIKWVGEGVEPHRKACLIIRQSLIPAPFMPMQRYMEMA